MSGAPPAEVAAPLAAEPSLPRAGLTVAPAMAAANAVNYAFNLVMLRLLDPAAYGALGALPAWRPNPYLGQPNFDTGTAPVALAVLMLGSLGAEPSLAVRWWRAIPLWRRRRPRGERP